MRPGVAMAAAIALAGASVDAHPLHESTARIALRDQHVEVFVEADVLPLADLDPTALATATEPALQSAYERLRRRVERETVLRADGATVPLVWRDGPDASELRALAATASAGDGHGALVRLRLEAPPAFAGVRRVSLEAPGALGAVVVSFTQPETRYTQPGAAARFEVLGPREATAARSPAPVEQPPSRARDVLAGALLGALATAAALVGGRARARFTTTEEAL